MMNVINAFGRGVGILLASAASLGAWFPKTLHILTWVFSFFCAIYFLLLPVYVWENMSIIPLIEGFLISFAMGLFCEGSAQLIDWRREYDRST